MQLRINGVIPESIVDGPGFRYVVFTQGCPHHCAGCHNPGTHSLDGGHLVDTKDLFSDIMKNPLLKGVTFSGGEPFLQAEALASLAEDIKETKLDLMTYTGYLYEDLLKMAENDPAVKRLLELTDCLVDGPFILAERDLEILFRGSRNQRLLYLQKDGLGLREDTSN